MGLSDDARHQVVAGAQLQAAGVHERKDAAVPFGVRVEPVAGGAGQILDDGEALADQAIEERRFADVRPAHDSDKWFHGCTSPALYHSAMSAPTSAFDWLVVAACAAGGPALANQEWYDGCGAHQGGGNCDQLWTAARLGRYL